VLGAGLAEPLMAAAMRRGPVVANLDQFHKTLLEVRKARGEGRPG
jgi:hypothetical protein